MNIFLPISLNIFLGAEMNRLNETVLLSTPNICFGREIRLEMCPGDTVGPTVSK